MSKNAQGLPFDPALHCGATGKRGGRPCRQLKGFRTDHPGFGHCWLHFGRSENGEKFARREKVERQLERLGVPVTTHPEQALLEVVYEAAGNVAFLRQECGTLGVNLGQMLTATRRDGEVVELGEQERLVVRLYGEWTDRLARYAKAAVDAGIAKRQVELAEQTADAIVAVINAVFDELGLDEGQREAGRLVAGTKLRLLAGGLAA